VKNSIGMKLVRIPAGKFMMGSTKAEQDEAITDYEKIFGEADETVVGWYRAEGPRHDVEITKAFWLGVHEVTQRQFKDVMGYNPSHFSSDGEGKPGEEYKHAKPAGGRSKVSGEETDDFPVENVSWDDAVEFCWKLTAREKGSGRKYRLPTEAEWEYACREGASSSKPFHFGNSLSSKQANFNGNYPYGGASKDVYLKRTCKVGSYRANTFGLHDMHGNVWEWCSDWYDASYYGKSPRRDPTGPSRGDRRVVRGGGWHGDQACQWALRYCLGFGLNCRSARRLNDRQALRDYDLGFRVVLVPAGR
jgi:formylglycine-generating enzyme required for sulfatase activity